MHTEQNKTTWQQTARGRDVCNADLSVENAIDEYVAIRITLSSSWPTLLKSWLRFQASIYGKQDRNFRIANAHRQPWQLLTAHAGVINQKSQACQTMLKATYEIFQQTGLPRKPQGRFRGEDSIDFVRVWDMMNNADKVELIDKLR